MGSEHYCLRWNNHQNNLLGVFNQLLRDESLVDVTLACSEGHSIRAHKVVLSACSSYFQTLFLDHPSRHPIVILKDVQFSELRTLVEFMYRGEVNVEYCQLSTLLKTADSLKIKGLAEMAPDYKESEETLLKEIITRRLANPTTRSLSVDETHQKSNSPSSLKSFRECKSPVEGDTERDEHIEPKDLSVGENTAPVDPDCEGNANNMATTQCSINRLSICNTLMSPSKCDTLASSSKMTQIQEAPMSLKKETEWVSEDDKNFGSPTEYLKLSNDPVIKLEDHRADSMQQDNTSSTQSGKSSPSFIFPYPTVSPPFAEVDLMQQTLLEDLFRCSSCMRAFPNLWHLERHVTFHHIEYTKGLDKPYGCEQCGQRYRYKSAYIKHREQNHRARLPANKLFSCDVCGMQFRYLKSFKKHRLNHTLEKLHGKVVEIPIVNGNGIMSNGENIYKKYGNEQLSNSKEGIIEDDLCILEEDNDVTTEGTSSDAERAETERNHRIIPAVHTSLLENPRKTSILRNIYACNNETETPLISFLTNGPRERYHDRRFTCPFCGKCIRSKENLKLHVRKHTGERPFMCLFCNRAFGGKSDLTRHLRIHTGERPYHCDMCGKCFARADYLSKHLTTHINTPH